jgi:hypothetical protein
MEPKRNMLRSRSHLRHWVKKGINLCK